MDWRDAAIEAKGATGNCEACGNDRWTPAEPNDVAIPFVGPDGNLLLGEFPGANPGIRLTVKMCTNCGLIRTFATEALKPSQN
jgi:hypothetical protein